MWMTSCPSTICRKGYAFSIALLLLLCRRSVDYINLAPFLDSLLFHRTFLLFFLPISHCLGYCSFILNLEIRPCQSSNFVLLFFHVNFRYCWYPQTGILIWIVLNLQIKLGQTDSLKMLSSYPCTRNISPYI